MLAAWRIRSALPTEVPPNFITVRLMDSYVGRELVTLVVQHAEAKSGKSANSIGPNQRCNRGTRRGRRPRLPGGAKLRCIADACDACGSGMVCTKSPDQPARASGLVRS